jgi:hypothetical protein
LSRLPTGKLYKTPLRDDYWRGRGGSRIVAARALGSCSEREPPRKLGGRYRRVSQGSDPAEAV